MSYLIVMWNSFWQEILRAGWSIWPKQPFTRHWLLPERRPATPETERLGRSGGGPMRTRCLVRSHAGLAHFYENCVLIVQVDYF